MVGRYGFDEDRLPVAGDRTWENITTFSIGIYPWVEAKGGKVVDVPRWSVSVFFSDTKRNPDENAIEDDRIEFWVQKILVAQDGGFMFYADGSAPFSDTFHLSTILPLCEEIYIFEVEKDPAKITGHEDRE